MARLILDIAEECAQQYTDQLDIGDIFLSRAEYRLPFPEVKHIRFFDSADLMNRLRGLKDGSARRLVIFYDLSRRKLPLLLRIAFCHGYFKTGIVYGSKSIFWHTLFMLEVLRYVLSKCWPARLSAGQQEKQIKPASMCCHKGNFIQEDCIAGVEPIIHDSPEAPVDEQVVPFFSPIFFRRTNNELAPIATVEKVGAAALHGQLDGFGAGAYVFTAQHRPLKFPYFYLKSPQRIQPLEQESLAGSWLNLTCFSNGYAHWLLDVLPALYFARDSLDREGRLGLIANSWGKFRADSIALLGMEGRDIHLLRQGSCLQVENLSNLVIPVNKLAVANGFRSFASRAYLWPLVRHLVARAASPDARHEIVGIRPGEKIHEQMIGPEDALYTYEYQDYYKVLPAIYKWSEDPERINGGKKVAPDFTYCSDNNTDWMSIDTLRTWIAQSRDKVGKF